MKITRMAVVIIAGLAGMSMGLYAGGQGANECSRMANTECRQMACPTQTITASKVIQETCPLTGEKINKAYYADVKGKRIYVCCPACLQSVKKEPDKYLKMYAEKGITLENAPAAPLKKKAAKTTSHH